VSPVKYELGFYIPEDAILHSHRRVNLKSYIVEATRARPSLEHGTVDSPTCLPVRVPLWDAVSVHPSESSSSFLMWMRAKP
jgi:hypothetical protein